MLRASAGVTLAAAVAAGVMGVAAASPPKSAFSPAGTTVAKSVALKLADLPAGWKAIPPGSGSGDVTCSTFDPDQSDLTRIGHTDAQFASADGLGSAGSSVGVFKSAAQAQASWTRIVRQPLARCLASLFKQRISASSGKAAIRSSGRLAVPLTAPRRAAYRIVADVTTSGQTVRAWLDVLLQGGGSADTVILVTAVASPPSAALETQLAAAIARRLPSR